MDNENFSKIIEKQEALEKEIMKVKGNDYTLENSDRHFNFKLVAQLVGITPEQVLMVYWLKHVLSLCNQPGSWADLSDPAPSKDLANKHLCVQAAEAHIR